MYKEHPYVFVDQKDRKLPTGVPVLVKVAGIQRTTGDSQLWFQNKSMKRIAKDDGSVCMKHFRKWKDICNIYRVLKKYSIT